MATARNRNVKVSPPVEEKVVETPQVEEVKEAPKPVEIKPVEAPKSKEVLKTAEVKSKNSSFTVSENDIVEGDDFKGKVVWISSAMSDHFDNDIVCIRLDSGKKIRKSRKEIKKVN